MILNTGTNKASSNFLLLIELLKRHHKDSVEYFTSLCEVKLYLRRVYSFTMSLTRILNLKRQIEPYTIHNSLYT